MKAGWYAQALYDALRGKNENDAPKIMASFHEVIKAHGHTGLLGLIPAEFAKIYDREKAGKEIILVTCDEKSRTKWVHAYDHYESEGLLPKDATRRDIVDDTIIGGFQIRTKDLLVDGSYKRSLLELYQNITTKN